MAKYRHIRNGLQTGDWVFFLGGGGLFSWLIQRGNRIAGITHPIARRFIHVGVVICDSRNDIVLLSESTKLSRMKDVTTGRRIDGLHTVALSDRIREAGGQVYIRQLKKPLTQQQVRALADLRHDYKGRVYERSYADLFRAAFDWFGPQNSGDSSSLFCSEWAAMCDQATGLLPDDPPADEYIPAEMALMKTPRHEMIQVTL